MLEVKNLHKTYYLKHAPETRALIDVSIKFENRGMVFILGKSGSGKSTFLNVVGGLDKADSGEIIIKGKSSKEFTGSDFDSYRNTYLGFIFQEYNIIEEFSISENIALALQLQHKQASKADVDKILKQVDIEGYGDRYPNQISGGQRQRVAIARALIKEPEIIFADEPTGALDSATGEQIFETLKKLSQDKLVIIVSHDRDYAEMFGDRIIEFKDGRIISDMIKEEDTFSEQIKQVDGAIVADKLIKIPAGTQLTQSHTKIIEQMLSEGELIISTNQNLNRYFADQFTQTKQRKGQFVNTKEEMLNLNEKTTPFKLIKSRLPATNARKMASSSMRHKRGRLIFSIILSIFAIVFFGFASVLGNFNQRNVVASVMRDYNYNHLTISRQIKTDGLFDYNRINVAFNDQQKEQISQITNGGMATFHSEYSSIPTNKSTPDSKYHAEYFGKSFRGVVSGDLSKLGLDIPSGYGRYPQEINEILIPNYVAQHFVAMGMRYYDPTQMTSSYDYPTYQPKNIADVISYVIPVDGSKSTQHLKIVGVINFNIERYKDIMLHETISTVKKTLLDEFNERMSYEISYIYGMEGLGDMLCQTYTNSDSFVKTNIDALYGGDWQPFVASNTLNYLGYYSQSYLGKDGSKTLPTLQDGQVIINVNSIRRIVNEINNNYSQSDYEILSDEMILETVNRYGLFDDNFKLNANLQSRYFNYTFDGLTDLEVVGAISINDYSYNSPAFLLSPNDHHTLTKQNLEDYIFVYLEDDATINAFTKNFVGDYDLSKGLLNSFTYFLPMGDMVSQISEMFTILRLVLYWISIAMCVFSALLLLNFISTSVAYKRKEIGILRAIGARKGDVVSIFMWEGIFIALWILGFAISLVFGIIVGLNNLFSSQGIPFTLLSFTLPNIFLMCAVCLGTIAVASILPVRKIASKNPIDAIRG